MTFDWRESLTLSEALLEIPGEAAQRSALSRAYYSAFCSTRNWLTSNGYVISSRRHIHRTIWNEMIDQLDPAVWSEVSSTTKHAARQLGNDGHRLRRLRERADYQDEFGRMPADIRTEVQCAAVILERLEQL